MAALVSATQASDLAQVETAIHHAEQAGLESTTEYSQAVVAAKDLRQQQVRLGLVPLWSVCVEQSRGRKRGTVCVCVDEVCAVCASSWLTCVNV